MEKIRIEPFMLIGISIRPSNENGQAAKEIADLWSKFLNDNVLRAIPNKAGNAIYSLYTDYEKDYTKPYTAILGCKVNTLSEIPDGMIGKSFEGGSYVKTSAKGDLMKDLVINKWSEIFKMNLDRIYTADFEIFGEKAQNPKDAEVDFYIAVRNQ